MPDPIASLRAAIRGHRRARTGTPDEVRRLTLKHLNEARSAGGSVADFADAIGLSKTTLYRWIHDADAPAPGFVAVHVVEAASPAPAAAPVRPTLSLLTPGGYRVDGLQLDDLARLLQAIP